MSETTPEISAVARKTTTTKKEEKKKNKKKVRMTQEQIDRIIRYQTVYIPEDAIPRVSKERLALAEGKDQSHLTVPMDQVDDVIANI